MWCHTTYTQVVPHIYGNCTIAGAIAITWNITVGGTGTLMAGSCSWGRVTITLSTNVVISGLTTISNSPNVLNGASNTWSTNGLTRLIS